MFSSDLIRREIQPVWVKVENHSARTYYMLSAATDPNYFSPLEVVYSLRGGLFGIYRDEMERHFRSMSFRNPISPHTAVSGFIFTNFRRVTPEDADEYRDPSDAFYKLRKEFGGLLEP
ncbi:MAG TPA: hypothetical protein VLT88_10785, partial [Desulfosarcina sp.]|nr:hypothetical protein [Desulfosarcina sp.]